MSSAGAERNRVLYPYYHVCVCVRYTTCRTRPLQRILWGTHTHTHLLPPTVQYMREAARR